MRGIHFNNFQVQFKLGFSSLGLKFRGYCTFQQAERTNVQNKPNHLKLEAIFGTLEKERRDERHVYMSGKVITARKLGKLMFFYIQHISSFILYSPNSIPENNNTILEEQKDIFKVVQQNNGSKMEFESEDKLQVMMEQNVFNGEIRENEDKTIDIYQSIKSLSRNVAVGDHVGRYARSTTGQLNLDCSWIKVINKSLTEHNNYPVTKIMNKKDLEAQGALPLCNSIKRGKECTNTNCNLRHSFVDEKERQNCFKFQLRRQQLIFKDKDPDDPHEKESKQHKRERAIIFVQWLLNNFKDYFQSSSSSTILDIAGGKGTISLMLIDKGSNCILVEPRENKIDKLMGKYNLSINMNGTFTHLQCKLDDDFIKSDEGKEAIRKADLVIGMHPDEATEAIVDLALLYNKPFAVVPCCVFPALFPNRILKKSGKNVVSYFEFVDYLLEKDPSIRVDHLPFKGRTRVLYKIN